MGVDSVHLRSHRLLLYSGEAEDVLLREPASVDHRGTALENAPILGIAYARSIHPGFKKGRQKVNVRAGEGARSFSACKMQDQILKERND